MKSMGPMMDDSEDEEAAGPSELLRLQSLLSKAPEARSGGALLGGAFGSAEFSLETRPPTSMVLPWELGFAGMVFGSSMPMDVPDQMLKVDLEQKYMEIDSPVHLVEDAEDDPEDKVQRVPMPQKTRAAMADEDKMEREKEMERWLVIAGNLGSSSNIVQMLDEQGPSVIEDIMARKKTGTLKVRSASILMYIRWTASKGVQPFPLRTDVVYKYVDELRKNKAPATRAASFRSALAFMKGVFNLTGVDEILDNSAISGSCHRSYMTKRVLKQRDALSVHQVRILETVVETGTNLAERVFAGHCLMCIYGRLRYGDSQGIETEPQVDGEYFEAGTSMHKTDSLVGRARRLLPVAAPAVGVTASAWSVAFLKARRDAGLRAGVWRPFMPAPLIGVGWSPGKLKTTEASMWLCEILQKYDVVKRDLSNVGGPLHESHGPLVAGQGWRGREGTTYAGVPCEAEGQESRHLLP